MRRFIQSFAGWLHRWTIGWFTRQPPPKKRTSRQQRLHLESLEDRRVFAAGFAEFIDPNPAPGNSFGDSIVPLSTGNVVITSPYDHAGGPDAGAVYLFNGRTGKLISTLTGSHADDHVGSGKVTALTSGNFVVLSPDWDSNTVVDASAATWGSGTVGVAGPVSAQNSLVGSSSGDRLGTPTLVQSGVTPLTNGNYVIASPLWDNGGTPDVGAATLCDGTTGLSGQLSATNSLVGSAKGDQVGNFGVTALTNGNYVVVSSFWSQFGAATFGSGSSGIVGTINVANSLIGATVGDGVGTYGVVPLTNGNYVVRSPFWRNGEGGSFGAVTFGNGTIGVQGTVTEANSLVGSTAGDWVGLQGVTPLTNGNYVVSIPLWHNGKGANFGAATFGNGTTGIQGTISEANSLVGSVPGDYVGTSVTALANGNYVVISESWHRNGLENVGAVTFGDGLKGIMGTISVANSLTGTTVGDVVGSSGVVALANGNYVVASPFWQNETIRDAGAATFGSGVTGVNGEVSPANSLVGHTPDDYVGTGITALTNGNYVVRSPLWDSSGVVDVGAVTFGDGVSGVSGTVSAANSLVGSTANDQIGGGGGAGRRVTSLANGNYVVVSPAWDNGSIIDAGAVTFGDGTTGVSGGVSVTNSLVGSTANDQLGIGAGSFGVTAMANGNYVVNNMNWDNGPLVNAGAVTFGNGMTGVKGVIDSTNSVVGDSENSQLGRVIVDDKNQNFYARFLADGGGRVRVGSQIDGFSHPWHFAAEPHDVNNDGHVVAEDVLTIINYINAGHPDEVPSDAAVGGPYGFLDVTGDGHVVAEDVIEVINYINAGHSAEGEAQDQASSATQSAASTPARDSAAPDLNDSLLLLLASDASSAKKRR